MSDIHILVTEATIALYIRNTEKIKANFTTMYGSCLVLNFKVDFLVGSQLQSVQETLQKRR